jgi:small subunit ribosomal protein S2e
MAQREQRQQGGDKKDGERGAQGRGGRGFGKGGKDGKGKGAPFEEEWKPVTKLGRLVKAGHIKTIEEIYKFSIPIKESPIVDRLLEGLKEEVMKVMPVQKQTTAGQRTRFKAFVLVGDCNGHLGLGVKAAKEVQGAVKGAIMDAKMNMVPIRRGYWGNKIGNPHTVPIKVTGKSGSVRVRLVPAPRGCGLVAAPAPKKVLQLAGIQDVYTSSRGKTKTRGNFLKAVYDACVQTYRYLTPDLWRATKYEPTIIEKYNQLA